MILLFGLLRSSGSFRTFRLRESARQQLLFVLIAPMCLLWVVSCIAETNRTPFDFSEGESELVSGFNVEYGGGLFAIIFMAEYAMIMFFSALTVSIFGVQQPLWAFLLFVLTLCVF